jgi:hypothetical protein
MELRPFCFPVSDTGKQKGRSLLAWDTFIVVRGAVMPDEYGGSCALRRKSHLRWEWGRCLPQVEIGDGAFNACSAIPSSGSSPGAILPAPPPRFVGQGQSVFDRGGFNHFGGPMELVAIAAPQRRF